MFKLLSATGRQLRIIFHSFTYFVSDITSTTHLFLSILARSFNRNSALQLIWQCFLWNLIINQGHVPLQRKSSMVRKSKFSFPLPRVVTIHEKHVEQWKLHRISVLENFIWVQRKRVADIKNSTFTEIVLFFAMLYMFLKFPCWMQHLIHSWTKHIIVWKDKIILYAIMSSLPNANESTNWHLRARWT